MLNTKKLPNFPIFGHLNFIKKNIRIYNHFFLNSNTNKAFSRLYNENNFFKKQRFHPRLPLRHQFTDY